MPNPSSSMNSAILTRQVAQTINDTVHKVCCFGSTNIGKHGTARTEYEKFIKAMTFTFLPAKYNPKLFTPKILAAITKKLSLTPQEKQEYDEIVSQGFVKPHTMSGSSILKAGENYFSLSLSFLLANPRVFEFINRVYPIAKTFDFSTLSAIDLAPVFAIELQSDSEQKKNAHLLSKSFAEKLNDPRMKEELKFLRTYNSGDEFLGDDKDLFMKKTFSDIKGSSFDFATGNCALMADVAFAEAINRLSTQNVEITYLRFVVDQNPKADVLNCVALGQWPNEGCIIIAPWVADGVIEWKGTIENTPRIQAIMNPPFNAIRLICHLSVEEIKTAKLQLDRLNYSDWMESPMRAESMKSVTDTAEAFMASIKPYYTNTSQLDLPPEHNILRANS